MQEVTISQDRINECAKQIFNAGISAWSDESKKIFPEYGFYDLNAIAEEVHRMNILKAIEAFETTDAIHLYMKEQVKSKQRGVRAPEKSDLSRFAQYTKSTKDQWGKTRQPWKPGGNTGLKMKLSEAVSFSYSQEAYADYSTTLIPVSGEINEADKAIAQRNVYSFFRYADSHTGWAGSGCNYTANLVFNSAGALIVLECRASISD